MVYKMIERSRGVVAFAVSLMAFGAFGAVLLLVAMFLVVLRNHPAVRGLFPDGIVDMPLFWISSYVNLFVFLSWVVCGAGTLRLREGARKFLRVVMVFHVFNMIINIILNIWLAEQTLARVPVVPLLMGCLISFSYYFAVIVFFSHPNVVRQFKFKSKEY
jgi:vacuolar-type H+-ATPase subunit I/STV1